MSEANKSASVRFVDEAFNKGNLAVIDELVADDAVDHNPPPGIAGDKAGIREIVQMFRSAFPDFSVEIEDAIAEGDKVAIRVVTRGTHTGTFLGIPATGKSFSISEQHIFRFNQGKMAEHWGVEDSLAMMQQLGIITAP